MVALVQLSMQVCSMSARGLETGVCMASMLFVTLRGLRGWLGWGHMTLEPGRGASGRVRWRLTSSCGKQPYRGRRAGAAGAGRGQPPPGVGAG